MSSNEPIRVDTDLLNKAAYALKQVVQHVQSATDRFIEDCDDKKDAIGDDKPGKEFHGKYDGNQEDLVQAGALIGRLLKRTSGEVEQLQRALENVEQTSTETGQRLTSEINNG